MGWKTFKEHYGIDHKVTVGREKKYGNVDCIFIGSAWIHDIIVIRMSDAKILREYDDGRTNDELLRYMNEFRRDGQQKMLELINQEDVFEIKNPVYKVEERCVSLKYCESYGWPNCTTEGEEMYENVFYADRRNAVRQLIYNTKFSPFWLEYHFEKWKGVWSSLKKFKYDIVDIFNWLYVRIIGKFIVKVK